MGHVRVVGTWALAEQWKVGTRPWSAGSQCSAHSQLCTHHVPDPITPVGQDKAGLTAHGQPPWQKPTFPSFLAFPLGIPLAEGWGHGVVGTRDMAG